MGAWRGSKNRQGVKIMHTRREIERRLGVCVLSGLLGIAACEGAPANDPGEAIEETSAALLASHALARGLVRDGAGAGFAHARVDVRAAGGHRIIARTTTKRDGTFVLDVRAGTYDLTVIPKTGFAPQIFPGQVIARGAQLELVITRVPATVTLTGQVTDQNGQPLSVAVCGVIDCVDTDDSGAFTVSARTDQGLHVSGSLSPAGSFNATVAFDPAQSSPLQIVIPIASLTGTVLDPSGAPMAGASVTSPSCSNVESDELGGTFCINGTLTDAAGRFQFTALPGDVALLVSGDLGAYVTESVAGDTDVTIQVAPLQSLSGRITDRDGNGLPGHQLCVRHGGCPSHSCPQSCAISDGSGAYALDVSAGTYDAQLISPSSSPPFGRYSLTNTITLSQATELDIAFPNRIVTGTVLDPNGETIRGAQLDFFLRCSDVDIDGFVGSVCMDNQTTDANGRFQLALAAPGDLSMRVFGEGVSSFDFTITDDSDIVVQFQPPLATSGQVLGADGSPIAGIGVCYNPTLPFSGSQRCATTDASGQYQLSLMPDTYLVSLLGIDKGTGISFISFTDTIPVPSPPTTIRLAATRSTPVKIVNADGSPLAGASLAAECFTAPAGDATENICGQTLVSDAAGTATVVDGVGVPLVLEISTAPGLAPPLVVVDKLAVGDNTELTVAIQSPPSP
jgi:hypothetical protein